MKTLLHFTLFISTLLIFHIEANAQYTFDGHITGCDVPPGNDEGEYINAYQPIPQPQQGSSTCDVDRAWADIYNENGTDYFILGLEHGNSGQSNFRLYINTDCDYSTGQQFAGENFGDPTCNVTPTASDTDGDGIDDVTDNCDDIINKTQVDTDGDGIGDACDDDDDNDGVLDVDDNCPLVANPGQEDADNNGIGDVCDGTSDSDGDGVPDVNDNCPSVFNDTQTDANGNGIGDVCEDFYGCIAVKGADYMVNFTTNQSPTVTVYQWNDATSQMEDTGAAGLEGLTGDSCDDSGDMVEIRIPVLSVFDPCNNNSCGVLELTTTISNAGGSPTSNFCDEVNLLLPIPINDPPNPSFLIELICDPNQIGGPDPIFPTLLLDASATIDPNLLNGTQPTGDQITADWSVSGGTGTWNPDPPTGLGPIDDINDADQFNVTFKPDAVGTYTFTLTVTDTFGCDPSTSTNTATASTTIEIVELTDDECRILPVELVSFSGSFVDDLTTRLNWTTASETNNDKFIIQRSYDGSNWEDAGEIAGGGNSQTPLNYAYTDNLGRAVNKVYYRLLQVDFDGSENYSNVIVLKANYEEDSMYITGTGQGGVVLLSIELKRNKYLKGVDIYNTQGQLVRVEDIGDKISSGIVQRSLDVSGLSAGIYMLVVHFSDGSLASKAIKLN